MAQFADEYRTRADQIRQSEEYRVAQILDEIILAVHERLSDLALTRSDLAKRLGVSKSAVSQLLAADSNPKLDTIVKLATALDMDLSISFREEEEKPPVDTAQLLKVAEPPVFGWASTDTLVSTDARVVFGTRRIAPTQRYRLDSTSATGVVTEDNTVLVSDQRIEDEACV